MNLERFKYIHDKPETIGLSITTKLFIEQAGMLE